MSLGVDDAVDTAIRSEANLTHTVMECLLTMFENMRYEPMWSLARYLQKSYLLPTFNPQKQIQCLQRLLVSVCRMCMQGSATLFTDEWSVPARLQGIEISDTIPERNIQLLYNELLKRDFNALFLNIPGVLKDCLDRGVKGEQDFAKKVFLQARAMTLPEGRYELLAMSLAVGFHSLCTLALKDTSYCNARMYRSLDQLAAVLTHAVETAVSSAQLSCSMLEPEDAWSLVNCTYVGIERLLKLPWLGSQGDHNLTYNMWLGTLRLISPPRRLVSSYNFQQNEVQAKFLDDTARNIADATSCLEEQYKEQLQSQSGSQELVTEEDSARVLELRKAKDVAVAFLLETGPDTESSHAPVASQQEGTPDPEGRTESSPHVQAEESPDCSFPRQSHDPAVEESSVITPQAVVGGPSSDQELAPLVPVGLTALEEENADGGGAPTASPKHGLTDTQREDPLPTASSTADAGPLPDIAAAAPGLQQAQDPRRRRGRSLAALYAKQRPRKASQADSSGSLGASELAVIEGAEAGPDHQQHTSEEPPVAEATRIAGAPPAARMPDSQADVQPQVCCFSGLICLLKHPHDTQSCMRGIPCVVDAGLSNDHHVLRCLLCESFMCHKPMCMIKL